MWICDTCGSVETSVRDDLEIALLDEWDPVFFAWVAWTCVCGATTTVVTSASKFDAVLGTCERCETAAVVMGPAKGES
jgi:hypothetical protein